MTYTLPKPAMKLHGSRKGKMTAESMDWFTADQMQAAYAAGQAAPTVQPLTDEQIEVAYAKHNYKYPFVSSRWSFDAGVAFAETTHGIGIKEQTP